MTGRTNNSESDPSHTWKLGYFLSFLVGIVLMYFEIGIYRVTMIRIEIPIAILLFVGLTAFIIGRSHYKKNYSVHGIFFPLMQSIVSCGFTACYLFMAANYYLADKEVRDSSFQIESKSSMPGPKGKRDKSEPLVIIDYLGLKKELVFKFMDTERVENADRVNVVVRKGLLGFDILDYYDVVASEE